MRGERLSVTNLGKLKINGRLSYRMDPATGQLIPSPQTTSAQSKFESSVLLILRGIERSKSGKTLLNSLNRAAGERLLEVAPLSKGAHEAHPNALTQAIRLKDSAPLGAPVRNLYGFPIKEYEDPVTGQGMNLTGTGAGSPSRILFDPSHWKGWCRVAGCRTDEILFHELVHAYRHLTGRCDAVGMTLNLKGHYPNREELLATVLTNIYTSEIQRGRPLRGGYNMDLQWPARVNIHDSGAVQQSGSLRKGYTYSETVMLENLGAISNLYASDTAFIRSFEKVETHFNPFRDYRRRYDRK